MKITETAIPGVLLFTPKRFSDSRGFFLETYNERLMQEAGLPTDWKQDNFSVSSKGVIRGIHYQVIQPQGKLVRVAFGAVIDAAIDLRKSSPTFGKHVAVELSEDNGSMLWIPPGFGHGFSVLTEKAGFAYKVTDYYSPAGERTILWNDPAIGVDWQVADADAVVSDKDRQGKLLADAEIFA
ncbi:dTDP-4-dehydrorhamnose 3,5-epimerase [Silvibacterium acidisoli]|uniref:dTDP-4-dehydrorhamnose 3,5-epimerase n=1 Tax=Acidobacteriaceae bacterium ZG23-2 TaxID=2883246 RepID=UPI00406CD251